MNEVDICYGWLGAEEGREPFAYNDSTGKRVTCRPNGNLSIAGGVNLENGLDDEEINWLSKHRLQKVAAKLGTFAWYVSLDDTRRAACLDMGFNLGVDGLLHFPHLIAALAARDWATAQKECAVSNPELKSRYDRLGTILLTGLA